MDHHAYLLLGEKGAREAYLQNLLESGGVALTGNPDLHLYEGLAFSVDTAREISEKSIEKAFGNKKVFIIKSLRWSPEAQNALLKTFEEPVDHTHFFVLAEEESIFLPTLLSRMKKIRVENNKVDFGDAELFLSLSYKDRFAFIKKFADDERNLAEFLDNLLLYLRSKGATSDVLEQIFLFRNFANDPATSSKLILEHLSLVLG